jgi:Ca2+-binding RTX toxin-like protein
MHSYLGVKSANITSAFQLTISSSSEIEKVVGGSGNDYLIGNALNNVLIGGAGDDLIFRGEGSYVVHSGPGQDQIDLSELISKSDVLTFKTIPADNGKDTVFPLNKAPSATFSTYLYLLQHLCNPLFSRLLQRLPMSAILY